MKRKIVFSAAMALLLLGFVDNLQASIKYGSVTRFSGSNTGECVWGSSTRFYCSNDSAVMCFLDLGDGRVWFNDLVSGGNPPPEPSSNGDFAPAQ